MTTAPLAAQAKSRTSITISRAPIGVPADAARALEAAVVEALRDTVESFDVQFDTWPAEDGYLQFVCRVEEAPAEPFGGRIQWRWWSAIFDDAQALRESLSAAVGSRRRGRDESGDSGDAAPPFRRAVRKE